MQHLGRGVDLDAVGLRPSDLAASLAEDLRRGASHELARREDVVFDAVQEGVRVEEPAFLDPDRGVRELPLQADRVVLSALSKRDDVVPRLDHAHVQLRLRLGVGIGHAFVD